MKHYLDPGSGSARRVTAVADLLGIKLEEVIIDLLKGEHRTPAYLALNPNGMVPTLVDGDQVLLEADAIMIHLAEQAGEMSLWPSGARRSEVLRWMFWAAEHFRQGPPILVEERYLKRWMKQPPDPVREAEGVKLIERFAPILDAHLADQAFVTGDQVTLADFALAAPLSHMERARLPFAPYPHILAWRARLEDIEAWRASGQRLRARMDQAAREAGLM